MTVFKDAISKIYVDTATPQFSFLFMLQYHALHIVRAIVLSDCLTTSYHQLTAASELGSIVDRFSAQGGLEILVKYLGWPVEHVNFVEGKTWQQV